MFFLPCVDLEFCFLSCPTSKITTENGLRERSWDHFPNPGCGTEVLPVVSFPRIRFPTRSSDLGNLFRVFRGVPFPTAKKVSGSHPFSEKLPSDDHVERILHVKTPDGVEAPRLFGFATDVGFRRFVARASRVQTCDGSFRGGGCFGSFHLFSLSCELIAKGSWYDLS